MKVKENIKKSEKGNYGYIDARKKKFLVFSIFSILSVFLFFFTGIIIYHSNQSLFSIIAAVATLPAAKVVISYIIIAPYKSGKSETYKTLSKAALKNNAVISCDMAITSEKKATFIQFAYIINGKVYLYTDYKRVDIKYGEKYIKEILDNNCNVSVLKIYTDEKKFLEMICKTSPLDKKNAMDERIKKQMLAFSV